MKHEITITETDKQWFRIGSLPSIREKNKKRCSFIRQANQNQLVGYLCITGKQVIVPHALSSGQASGAANADLLVVAVAVVMIVVHEIIIVVVVV